MKTIEVEKKVSLQPHDVKKIAQTAKLIREIQIQDRYFDTRDYRYTSQNIWLRQRNGIFELKVGIKGQAASMDLYEEITDEKSILKYLEMDISENLESALSQKALLCFCSFAILRRSYQLGEFQIDIDEANFGDLCYQVAEIEIIVPDLDQVQDAEQKLAQFISDMSFDTSIPVTGKLTYYLYCRSPEHYQVLVRNNVIPPFHLPKAK